MNARYRVQEKLSQYQLYQSLKTKLSFLAYDQTLTNGATAVKLYHGRHTLGIEEIAWNTIQQMKSKAA